MKYGLIGEKLGHSFSKEIHNKLFDYNYELKEIASNDLDAFLKAKDFCAINVTIPYKERVIPYLDFISDKARQIGAVNTIVNKDGKLFGFNTDFLGLKTLILKNGIEIKNKKVLILGSGGTSKTAFVVAKNLNAKEIVKVSRKSAEGFITYEEISNHNDAEIIINTTPVGMYPEIENTPLDITNFKDLEGVIDVVYNPLSTKLVNTAKQMGIKAVGGLYMLVSQAAFAAEKFLDTTVENQKIDQIYNEILKTKQNIVLIGMAGCGKTTVGKNLAEKIGFRFIDTDEEIVKKYGDIVEIFKTKGETAFRKMESEIIKEISALQGVVIATGGGAVLKKDNIDSLKLNGKIYFLDRPLEDIIPTSDRPLSSNKEDLEKRFYERYDIYLNACDKRIEAKGNIENTVNCIRKDF